MNTRTSENTPWRFIRDVHERDKLFSILSVGDKVGIDCPEDSKWWHGEVVSIEKKPGDRYDRFQDRVMIKVDCQEPEDWNGKVFFADDVQQVLVADKITRKWVKQAVFDGENVKINNM